MYNVAIPVKLQQHDKNIPDNLCSMNCLTTAKKPAYCVTHRPREKGDRNGSEINF